MRKNCLLILLYRCPNVNEHRNEPSEYGFKNKINKQQMIKFSFDIGEEVIDRETGLEYRIHRIKGDSYQLIDKNEL